MAIEGIFTFSEFYSTVKLLALFVVGMVLYSVFIFKFYKLISKRDLFDFNLRGHATTRFFKSLLYLLEHLIIFPLLIFTWFIIISSLILLLSKTGDIGNVLLMSIALTATVRIAAYYNESLSQDLAKLLPFVLLGVLLIDITAFSIEKTLATAVGIADIWRVPVYYLFFVIGIETVMRLGTFVTGSAFKKHVDKEEVEKLKAAAEAINEEKKEKIESHVHR